MKQSQPNDPLGLGAASPGMPGGLHPTKNQFARAMDAIPAFVWSALPDGAVDFCNQKWLDYAGMSLDGITGGELAAALRPKDKNDLEEKWRAALSQGQPLETEARLLRADGCHRWFSIRAVPLRDHKGEISGWYGANVEIEELKRAQGELLKQTSRLDELFEETPEAVALLTDDDRVVRINK